MLQFAARRVAEMPVEGAFAADLGVHSSGPVIGRNGHCRRQVATVATTLRMRIRSSPGRKQSLSNSNGGPEAAWRISAHQVKRSGTHGVPRSKQGATVHGAEWR